MIRYNENDELFCRSMIAVMKNIAFLCNRLNDKFWDKEGWKKIVVCIVSDGRSKIHPRVLTTLGIMGIYQDGIMKNVVNGKEVTAHIFEYTTQIGIDKDMKIRTHNQGYFPMQVIFCLKEKNAKKVNLFIHNIFILKYHIIIYIYIFIISFVITHIRIKIN